MRQLVPVIDWIGQDTRRSETYLLAYLSYLGVSAK